MKTSTIFLALIVSITSLSCREEIVLDRLEYRSPLQEWTPLSSSDGGITPSAAYTAKVLCDAPEWVVTHHGLPKFKYTIENKKAREGKHALKLTNASENPHEVWVWRFEPTDDLIGQKILFTAYIKPENWEGVAMIGHGPRTDDYTYKLDTIRNKLTNGKWIRLSTEIDLAPDKKYLSLGLAFLGKGTMWVDDCTIEKLGPSVYGEATHTTPVEHRNLGFEDGKDGGPAKNFRGVFACSEPINR